MNQTWKNDKKTNFGPNFVPFLLEITYQSFFREFYLYEM